METLTLANFMTLAVLVLLQAVLGFDNLLYISLESKHAPPEKQAFVQRLGITIAIVLRIALLFILIELIKYFQNPIVQLRWEGIFFAEFNIHSLIVLAGGGFISHTAIKEIWHMLSMEEHAQIKPPKKPSLSKIITMIVLMNLVFSFDSILSAMALSDVFWVMATAIIIGGLLMMLLARRVTRFLQKNRMYEVLGLFVLFLVGIMLLTEGGHLAHINIVGNEIQPLSKTTFYFVIVFLILVDLVQTRYQKNLMRLKQLKHKKQEKPANNEK